MRNENQNKKKKREGQQPTGPHPGPKPEISPALHSLFLSLTAERDPPVGSFFSNLPPLSFPGNRNRRPLPPLAPLTPRVGLPSRNRLQVPPCSLSSLFSTPHQSMPPGRGIPEPEPKTPSSIPVDSDAVEELRHSSPASLSSSLSCTSSDRRLIRLQRIYNF
jgi:hypothetical protein